MSPAGRRTATRILLLALPLLGCGGLIGAAPASAATSKAVVVTDCKVAKSKPSRITLDCSSRHTTSLGSLSWTSFGGKTATGKGRYLTGGHSYPVKVTLDKASGAPLTYREVVVSFTGARPAGTAKVKKVSVKAAPKSSGELPAGSVSLDEQGFSQPSGTGNYQTLSTVVLETNHTSIDIQVIAVFKLYAGDVVVSRDHLATQVFDQRPGEQLAMSNFDSVPRGTTITRMTVTLSASAAPVQYGADSQRLTATVDDAAISTDSSGAVHMNGSGTLSSTYASSPPQITLTIVCRDATGAIDGGGSPSSQDTVKSPPPHGSSSFTFSGPAVPVSGPGPCSAFAVISYVPPEYRS